MASIGSKKNRRYSEGSKWTVGYTQRDGKGRVGAIRGYVVRVMSGKLL